MFSSVWDSLRLVDVRPLGNSFVGSVLKTNPGCYPISSVSQSQDLVVRTPLIGAPLVHVRLHGTKIRDLTPLADMPLKKLEIGKLKDYPASSIEIIEQLKAKGCEVKVH